MTASMKLENLKQLKKRGFNKLYQIGFGDNDGDVQGEGAGKVMDYEGRTLEIDSPDIVMFTEQNR